MSQIELQPGFDFQKAGKAVLEIEREGLAQLDQYINQDFTLACEMLFRCSGKVVVMGMGKSVIGEWTGLTRERAALARLHEASVTLIWRDSDERMAAFSKALDELGLKFVQGARFWHILDERGGKDQALNWLVEQYRQREGSVPVTLGLGDGPNDAPLLDSVDYAVVVKGINRLGVHLQNDSPERVYHTLNAGPEGWREGLDYRRDFG
jgi:mannosyl-3-phosphoglycerate phosphatase family protein